jgi:hypothetical protein
MTHHQVLIATGAKIINTTVQLCLTLCYELVVLLCVDITLYYTILLNSVFFCVNHK